MIGRPLYLDFSGEPPDPDWIVDGLFERGTLTVIAAAPSAGKSFVCASLIVALIQGKPWLGRPTHGQRVLYIDGENHPRVVRWRLQGLGMENEDRDNLRYFLREGVRIGEGAWLEKVKQEIDAYRPDLFILDTATSTLAVKNGNDNSEVGNIMGMLRGLCESGLAMILLQHERKPSSENASRDASAAMLGAGQWQGQADQHLSLLKLGSVERSEQGEGRVNKRFRMRLELPKNRDGDDAVQELAILSEHAANGKPIRTRVVAT